MKELYKALADFQQKVPIIFQETTGHNYTYASIGQIITKIKPVLLGCHLGFNQRLDNDSIITTIFHVDSGEYLESTQPIPRVELRGMNPYQSFGSGITYYRRYALATMLGLVTDKDADACGDYDNGIVDDAISPTAFGDDLINQLAKRIMAIHKQIGIKGDATSLEDLLEIGEVEAIQEFNLYKIKLAEHMGKKWIDDMMTKPKKSGSVEALRDLWVEAQKRGFLTDYAQEIINSKVESLKEGK
jgi:hypothetical protein